MAARNVAKLTSEQAQQLENIQAYAAYLGLKLQDLFLLRVDVAYQKNGADQEATMSEVILGGPVWPLVERLTQSQEFEGKQAYPHPGFTLNFRQNCLRWSMQININPETQQASFDIDRWNPNYGVLGALMHAMEVLYDKCAACDTDPRAVAHALRKKGISVLDCFA